MIYFLLKQIFRITNRFYFRKMEVRGLDNIPREGPVMLVANHPSTLMDPMIVATVCKRRLHFLAKGSLFENRFVGFFLRRLNLIPIYRKHETPGKTRLNKDSFEACYRHFEKAGIILIFPEGISLTNRQIKKIQTGTARICLGAEAENNFELNLQIIPIGLNYSNPHQFQSDLFVDIGEPIRVSKYKHQYAEDHFRASHALTEEIGDKLYEKLVAMADKDEEQLVMEIEAVYKGHLLKAMDYSSEDMPAEFETTKAIRDSVKYFRESAPERVARSRKMLSSYLQDLERLSIENQTLDFARRRSTSFDMYSTAIFLLLGFPLFAFGFVHNFVPFRLPYWTARYINKQPEYYGSISYTVGTFAFIIFYTLVLRAFYQLNFDLSINILYAIFLPVSGLFAFYYYKNWQKFKNKWALFSLFYRRSEIVSDLVAKREKIMSMLEKGRQDYLEKN